MVTSSFGEVPEAEKNATKEELVDAQLCRLTQELFKINSDFHQSIPPFIHFFLLIINEQANTPNTFYHEFDTVSIRRQTSPATDCMKKISVSKPKQKFRIQFRILANKAQIFHFLLSLPKHSPQIMTDQIRLITFCRCTTDAAETVVFDPIRKGESQQLNTMSLLTCSQFMDTHSLQNSHVLCFLCFSGLFKHDIAFIYSLSTENSQYVHLNKRIDHTFAPNSMVIRISGVCSLPHFWTLFSLCVARF